MKTVGFIKKKNLQNFQNFSQYLDNTELYFKKKTFLKNK